ncbi:MAG: DUF5666 domain-containing protein [Anaerolineae bacterium]
MGTKLLLTGATLLTLVFGSVGISAALPGESATENPAQRGPRVYGVVDDIEGETLRLVTPVGSVALITDANTIFRIPDAEEPGLDDLAVGDILAAAGWWEQGDSVFHAFGVARLETDRAFPLAGKLADVGDDTLTVETGHGLATVRVGDETMYRIRGVEEPGLDDLAVEMRVVARGTLNPDGSLQAQVVAVPQVGPRQVRLRGEVVAVEGGTLTVRAVRDRRFGRQFNVLTGETTEFRVPGVENPSSADLQVGDRIAGEGVIKEEGVLRATLVVVLPEQVARLAGEVSAVEGTTLVLDTPGGALNVLTDTDTVFRIPGIEEPTLGDVEVGERAIAVGTWENATTFHAIGVGVHGGRRAGRWGIVRGRVISVGTGSLIVGTSRGPVTVVVGGETRYRVPGMDDPGLDNVETGASVGARGTWNEHGTLQATGVAVLGSHEP